MPNLWTGQLNFAATPLVLAEVCERYGAYEQAIEFTSLGLPPKAGEHPAARTTGCNSCLTWRRHCTGEDVRKVDIRPSVHACAYSILGRCLARQQNFAKAAEAFEQSVQIAHQVRTTFPSPAHAQLCNAKDQGAVAHSTLQNCSTGTSCWSCSRCATSSSGSCRFA